MRLRTLLLLALVLVLPRLAAADPARPVTAAPGNTAAAPARPVTAAAGNTAAAPGPVGPAASDPGRLLLPDFTGLARRATQSVDVTLDPAMLRTASDFLGGRDQAKVRSLVSGLRGIYVHSYQFAHDDAYSKADVRMIEAQLTAPRWRPLVSVHDDKRGSGTGDVEVYVCREHGITEGMAIVAAQPRQLTVVNIVGEIDLSKLAQLQGQFGVPRVGLGK